MFEIENKENCRSFKNVDDNKSQCSVKFVEEPTPIIQIQRKSSKQSNIPIFDFKRKSKSCDRWKLKDFYDPLLQEF